MDDMLKVTTIRPLPGAWMAFAALFLGAANGQPAPLTEEAPPEVRIQVVDADTGAAIPSFRFLRGTPAGNVSGEEFRKKHDVEVANWQPHLIAIGKDGQHVWSLSRAWDRTALRIEADGYIPEVHTWILREEGSQEIEFRLKKDPGVEAKVLLPDGKPAPNAQVGVALIHREVSIVGTRIKDAGTPLPTSLRDRWQRPPVHETDAEGRCRLSTETDPAAMVVAVHPAGIAEMSWMAFEKTKVLRLKKWGRVEGKVTLGANPGGNLEVTLGTQSEEHAHPGLVAALMTARSDAEGQFTFEHVPPGTVQVSLFDFFPAAVEDAPFLDIPPPPGAFTHVEVKPGTTARVDLGGKDLPALREMK